MSIINDELVGEGASDDTFSYPNESLGKAIERTVQENISLYGDATWMTDLTSGESMTYGEMTNAIRKLSGSLRRRGLCVGDTVLLVASNHIQLALVYFAVWKAGGCCASLTLDLFPEDIKFKAKETKAKFIFIDEPQADRVAKAIVELNIQVFVIGEAEGFVSFCKLLEEEEQDYPNVDIDLNSPAWLTYSSGTTGIPKGIVHTNNTLSSFLILRNKKNPLIRRKKLYTNLMIHGSGLAAIISGALSHEDSYIFSDLSEDSLLRGIHNVRPRCVSIYPFELAEICRHTHLDQYDLSSVDTLIYTACSTLPIYEHQIFQIMPNLINLISMYGSSETMILTIINPESNPLPHTTRQDIISRHRVGSSGKIVPFVKLKIVDPETGEKLGVGQVGEITAKTPFFMRGYLNRPEILNGSKQETARTLRDGYFQTGDQGYYDADGNLFVIGRYKELIKYRICHVIPTNIEKHMTTHPAVEDVAVIGRPHEIDGEHPVACVVLKENAKATAEELVQFTNERVVDAEHLRGGVHFIDRVPRNILGKIVRHQLLKQYLAVQPST